MKPVISLSGLVALGAALIGIGDGRTAAVVLAAIGLMATAGAILWACRASWSLEERIAMGLEDPDTFRPPMGGPCNASPRTGAKADPEHRPGAAGSAEVATRDVSRDEASGPETL